MNEPVTPSAVRVGEFWDWFSRQAPALAENLRSVDHRTIDCRVKSLHAGLVWELGPGLQTEFAFIVSPGGVRSLLPVSDFVVGQAPSIPDWEFHAAKPPKRWSKRILNLRSKSQSEAEGVEVNLDLWRYSIVAWNNCEFFDITFIAPPTPDLAPRLREQAAWQLLDGELGERFTIEQFAKVKVVSAREWNPDEPSGEVPLMRDHIHGLVASGLRGGGACT